MTTPPTAWNTADSQLASLTFDSLMTGGFAIRGIRGASSWRQLSFRASGLTIELSVTATGPARRLIGQLLPRQPARVDIRYGDTVTTVVADRLGRFAVDDVPAGTISIRCRLGVNGLSDDAPVVTGWISI